MEYRVLGPLEVVDGRRSLDLGRPRQRATLAILLSQANHVVAIDRLLDLLWWGEPPDKAVATLQTYVSNLRRLLDPDRPQRARSSVLVTRAPGYSLCVDPADIDASAFAELAASGHRALTADPARARDLLTAAEALWRDDAYVDFGDESWALAERNRLSELRLRSLEDRVEAELALANHRAIIAEVGELVARHPRRERLRGQLMLALYRSGRQSDALQVYEDGRRLLADELGLEPAPELRRLQTAILRQELEVAAPRPPASALIPPARLTAGSWDPGFVGRTDELTLLDELLDRASTGSGAVVIVEGSPGGGKTTLMSTLCRRARARRMPVLHGRGLGSMAGPPLWPWPDLLATAQALFGAVSEPEQLYDRSTDEPDPDEPASVLGPTMLRSRLFGAVGTALYRLGTGSQPALVAIDDLDRCGDDALALAVHVAGGCDQSPVVFVVTVSSPRSSSRPALDEALAAIARLPWTHRISLADFTRVEVVACLEALLGTEPEPATVDTVVDRAGGNPFFTVELGRTLALRGTGDHDVPGNVRDVVIGRVARLPAASQHLLETAAIAGRRVDLSLLADVEGIEVAEVSESLEPAEANGLIVPDGQIGSYRFAHGIVADALATSVPRLAAARMHAHLARAMARRYADEPGRWAEIATSFESAEPVLGTEPTLDWLARAARHAAEVLAFEDAERLHRRQLDAAHRMADGSARWRAELTAHRELAALLTWQHGQQADVVGSELRDAFACARQLADTDAAAAAAWGLWSHESVRGRVVPRASDHAAELSRLAAAANDDVLGSLAQIALGATAWMRGDHVAALSSLEQAEPRLEALARRFGPATTVQFPGVHWGVFTAMASCFTGDHERARTVIEATVDSTVTLGHAYTEQFARSFQLLISVFSGEVDSVLRTASALESASIRMGFAYTASTAACALGWARARSGDQRGIAQLTGVIASRRAMGASVALPALLGLLGEAQLACGRPREALSSCAEGLAIADQWGERYWSPELHRVRADALCALDDRDGAAESRRAAIRLATEQHALLLLDRALASGEQSSQR